MSVLKQRKGGKQQMRVEEQMQVRPESRLGRRQVVEDPGRW